MAVATAAAAPGVNIGPTAPLSQAQLQPVIQKAVRRWTIDASDCPVWEHLEFQIADLPHDQLGFATASAIWIDEDAAGWGWFIDASPWKNIEHAAPAEARASCNRS